MRDYKNTTLYTKVFQHMRPDFGLLWSVLEVIQPRVLAEFGCGNGRLLPLWLASSAEKILGLDIEAQMLAEFASVPDARIETTLADLREVTPVLETADIIILTSSVLKHLEETDRRKALRALGQSLGSGSYLYLDHCSHLYGLPCSTPWRTYYETLRCWWPEERRQGLKRLYWRKEVQDKHDTLYYRDERGRTAGIETRVYEIAQLKEDIESVGLQHATIATRFPAPTHLTGMERFIGLVSQKDVPKSELDQIATSIHELAFEELTVSMGEPGRETNVANQQL